jgi:thiamine-phosphate pyrophosphorylase
MIARPGVVRLLDANVNRAFEGLRVCEDVVRFCLGTGTPFRRLRSLRHALAAQVRRLPLKPVDLVRCRNSQHDPGRRAQAPRVPSTERLLLMNLQRTKEALRVLEESSRVIAPRLTRRFQRLRFRAYDVERDLLIRVASVRHSRHRRRSRP